LFTKRFSMTIYVYTGIFNKTELFTEATDLRSSSMSEYARRFESYEALLGDEFSLEMAFVLGEKYDIREKFEEIFSINRTTE
jgi:hypothetical protein